MDNIQFHISYLFFILKIIQEVFLEGEKCNLLCRGKKNQTSSGALVFKTLFCPESPVCSWANHLSPLACFLTYKIKKFMLKWMKKLLCIKKKKSSIWRYLCGTQIIQKFWGVKQHLLQSGSFDGVPEYLWNVQVLKSHCAQIIKNMVHLFSTYLLRCLHH